MMSSGGSIDWVQLLTILIALYGAGLATYTFIVGRRRALRVELSHGYAPLPNSGLEHLIAMQVSNPGYHNVTVTSLTLELPNKKQLFFPNPRINKPLPHELTPGTNLTMLLNALELARNLVEAGFSDVVPLTGVCSDAVGGKHHSKPFKFEVSDVLNDTEQ